MSRVFKDKFSPKSSQKAPPARQQFLTGLLALFVAIIFLTGVLVYTSGQKNQEGPITSQTGNSASQTGLDSSQEDSLEVSSNSSAQSSLGQSSSAQSSKPKIMVDRVGKEIEEFLKKNGRFMGNLYAEQLKDLEIKPPIDVDLNKPKEEAKEGEEIPKSLDDLLSRPVQLEDKNVEPTTKLEKKNLLVMPDYNVEAPIVHLSFDDMYGRNADGSTNFQADPDYPLDLARCQNPVYRDTCHPVQRKLELGTVHVPFSPQPGELGNAYIAGHTSNWNFIQSPYNAVFKPLEGVTKNGDVMYIYDMYGRKLKFTVFESLEIAAVNEEEAYKFFPDKRTVTLQGSVLKWVGGTLQPTHRWLTRAELDLEGSKKFEINQSQSASSSASNSSSPSSSGSKNVDLGLTSF